MSDERVSVSIRGSRPFEVNRHVLASELKTASVLAGHLGKRPGEPTGAFHPNENLSTDVLTTMLTVLHEHGDKSKSRKK